MAALVVLAALAFPAGAAAVGRCGEHPWCDTKLSPDKRAGLLLKALTQSEKVGLLGGDSLDGVGGGAHAHTGAEDGVARVGLPPVYYSDGPVGPRQGKATPMPIPMALAATFDPAMAVRHGATIAGEARDKGNDVVFAPTVNIMRTPLGGRTFEGYGEDPYLVGRLAVGWIKGAQGEGVIGNIKHFAANNQEGEALPVDAPSGLPIGFSGFEGQRMIVDARVDDRTLHEIYLPQFEAAVKEANVGSIMCSYNRLNGQWACENNHLLNDILKRQWGFKGYVLADYGAAHNTIASLNNGLDFEPWPAIAYSPPLIHAALLTSLASSDDLDDHVRRMLRTLFAFGFFDRAAYRDDDAQIDKAAHLKTAGEIEESAITLLKNDPVPTHPILPLDPAKLKSIAIIGADANSFKTGGGSANVDPFSFTTPRDEITKRAGAGVTVTYDPGDDAAQAADVAKGADVALVFASDTQTEGSDKRCLSLDCGGRQDALISAVAAANAHTVVVLETGGPVLTPWRDAVPGLVEAWFPGADGGTAIARVLFGDVDAAGRLPVTFPKREADLPTAGDPQKYPGTLETVRYKEGVLVGYRWFDAKKLEPAFPFGAGLSYTTFDYRGLSLRGTPGGGLAAAATIDVLNMGTRAGVAVPQLYLGLPQPEPGVVQPPRQLRGFQKVTLPIHTSRRVTFGIDARALSYWDAEERDWRVAPGCYDVMVGRSSRDIIDKAVLGVGDESACPNATVRIPVPPVASAGARACAARTVSLRLDVRRATVRRVTVYVDGKKRAVVRGRRSRVRVRLTGANDKARVRMVVQRTKGKAVTRTRTLKRCPTRA